jgi:chaperonin cofactor prefoldin
LSELQNEEKLLKSELHMMKKQNEKLQTQIEAMEAA